MGTRNQNSKAHKKESTVENHVTFTVFAEDFFKVPRTEKD